MRKKSKHAQAVLDGDDHEAAVRQPRINHRTRRSSPIASASPTPLSTPQLALMPANATRHGPGICAIRGGCGKKSIFSPELPCPDDDDAEPVSGRSQYSRRSRRCFPSLTPLRRSPFTRRATSSRPYSLRSADRPTQSQTPRVALRIRSRLSRRTSSRLNRILHAYLS